MKSEPVKLDTFMARAQDAGALTVTHVRSVRRVRSVEGFVAKLTRQFKARAPEARVTTAAITRAEGSSLGVTRGGYERAMAQTVNVITETMTDAEAFSVLHEAGRHAYAELLSRAPGKGSAVAGASLHLAAGIPDTLRRGVDSVFQTSFADAYAVFRRNEDSGSAAALAMGQEALRVRTVNGDYGAFSQSPVSADTRAALVGALGRVRNGSVQGTTEIEALAAACHGVGGWLAKHGVAPGRAEALSGFVLAMAQGLSSPAPDPKLHLHGEHADEHVDDHTEQVATEPVGSRPRSPRP
jgi:hypothetical protein